MFMTNFRCNLAVSALPSSGPFAEFAAVSSAGPVGGFGLAGGEALTETARYRVKRAIDRVVACLALVALLPLMVTIAAVIRLEGTGPALLRETRVGFRERRFGCYTFRTMSGAARVTRFGRFLRRSALDQLPQLLNVLRGEMSLVGPLAHAPDPYAAGRSFAELVPFYDRRHAVHPGITGWAQVNGWRGDLHLVNDIEMRVRYDLEYIYGWSLLFDLRVMALALVRVFNDHDAV
jgi:putative colanic acid biosynthesis UDP-glucose lipid carrier transferase